MDIDGQTYKKMLNAAFKWLHVNRTTVNALNVFPVPNGDTGTHMVLTLQSAWRNVELLDSYRLDVIAAQFSQGASMGARGISGMILSRILQGFAKGVNQKKTLDKDTFVGALREACDTAYKGVDRPVEGTILTVMEQIARAAESERSSSKDAFEVLEIIVNAADKAVQNTPDTLPILRKSGVVDAGGKGLFFVFEGMLRRLQGQTIDSLIFDTFENRTRFVSEKQDANAANIFISYARTDAEIAQGIYETLSHKNQYPWMDIYDLHGGENWQRAIYKAIDNSDIFIALLSNNSVSRRGVIQKELKKALDKWEGMLPDDIYIVPVRVDDCPIPDLLKHIQVLDWDGGKGENKLLEAIRIGLARRKADG